MEKVLLQSILRPIIRLVGGFYIYLADDDPAGAHENVDETMRRWSPRGFQLQHSHAYCSQVFSDLYAGDPDRAWERVVDIGPRLRRSLLTRAQVVRVLIDHYLRGPAAVMRAAHLQNNPGRRSDWKNMLDTARKVARLLRRERAPYTDALATAIQAASEYQRGNVELYAWQFAAQRVRGLVIGGDEGQALVDETDRLYKEEGVTRPDRFANLMVPGFFTQP